MAAPPSDDLHIPKEELKEENFTTVRRCAESYGESAEIVEFKGTGSENMDCVRVKVGEREGPLDLDRAHALADKLAGKTLVVMHPTYIAADGVYMTISAPRGAFSSL